MRHRGRTKTVSFRLGGKALDELERQAEEFGLSPGELSRALIDRHLKNEEIKAVLEAVEGLAGHHQRLAEAVTERLEASCLQLASLRRDFNRAVGRDEPA